jgi:hypothetical protein
MFRSALIHEVGQFSAVTQYSRRRQLVRLRNKSISEGVMVGMWKDALKVTKEGGTKCSKSIGQSFLKLR